MLAIGMSFLTISRVLVAQLPKSRFVKSLAAKNWLNTSVCIFRLEHEKENEYI